MSSYKFNALFQSRLLEKEKTENKAIKTNDKMLTGSFKLDKIKPINQAKPISGT